MSLHLSSSLLSSSGSSIQRFRCINDSENALDTSLVIKVFRLLALSIVAASLKIKNTASDGGVPANSPSASPVLNSLPITLLLIVES